MFVYAEFIKSKKGLIYSKDKIINVLYLLNYKLIKEKNDALFFKRVVKTKSNGWEVIYERNNPLSDIEVKIIRGNIQLRCSKVKSLIIFFIVDLVITFILIGNPRENTISFLSTIFIIFILKYLFLTIYIASKFNTIITNINKASKS